MLILILMALQAQQLQVTAVRTNPLDLYDEQGMRIERVLGKDLPKLPWTVTGTNEFGYIQVVVNGKSAYVRPADVQHNVQYCSSTVVTARSNDSRLAGGKPGVKRGASEGGVLCIQR